jgi:hypothetical protein
MKIVWHVDPEPTGRYRSFRRRSWPEASYGERGGKPAAFLYCDDEYVPRLVREGRHGPISIVVLNHNDNSGRRRPWVRFVLKEKAKTLAEAKARVESFLDSHPEWHPKSDV